MNHSSALVNALRFLVEFLNPNISFIGYKLGLTESTSWVSLLRNVWVNSYEGHSTIMSIKWDLTIWSDYYHHCYHNPFKTSQFLEEDPEVKRGKVTCPKEMSLGCSSSSCRRQTMTRLKAAALVSGWVRGRTQIYGSQARAWPGVPQWHYVLLFCIAQAGVSNSFSLRATSASRLPSKGRI